ncbi:MAG: hypothetical protein ABSF64_01255 [Bryobacteraceae bacterium]|jgi:hypothetical protein
MTAPALAQLREGDLSADLTGTVSTGYTADYGNLTASDHGVTLGGAASLTGSYYNPGFFSFNIQPFYNQSRTNSDFQSITNSSGVNANASIFGGSNFPGSISYSNTLNGEGNFGVPGLANYTSHGDSQVFSIGWGEHVAKLPSLSIGYQQGTSDYSIYGTDTNSTSDFRSFVATSSYTLLGFNFNGSYHYSTTQSQFPQLFSDQQAEKSGSDTTSYSFGLGHALPFHGTFSAGATRSDLDYTSTEGNYNGTLDTAYTGLIFNPVEHLTFGANAQYLDNLTGELYQSLASAGGIAAAGLPTESSHALDVSEFASYVVPAWHTSFNGTDQYQGQRFAGEALDSNSLTGTATYANVLMGGMLNATAGAVRSTMTPTNATHLGFIGSVNYSREIRRWSVSGLVNYAEDQQTLLASYLTNTFGYSGNLSHRFGRKSTWTNVASGTKSGLVGQAGSTSFSQAYSSTLFHRWISGTVAYSRSSGNAILTSSGLVATPIPLPVISQAAVVLYGGHAISFGVGATPVRGLTFSASYSQAQSETENGSAASNNNTSQLTARILYIVRKTYFQAGYSRLIQGFTATGTPPSMLGSFYVGLTRWFSFF